MFKKDHIYPFDEGLYAAKIGKSIHTNPYKAPNISKTDDVKSEAWLRGFMEGNTPTLPKKLS